MRWKDKLAVALAAACVPLACTPAWAQYAQARKMMKSLSGGLGFMGKRMGKMKLPPGFPFGQMPGM